MYIIVLRLGHASTTVINVSHTFNLETSWIFRQRVYNCSAWSSFTTFNKTSDFQLYAQTNYCFPDLWFGQKSAERWKNNDCNQCNIMTCLPTDSWAESTYFETQWMKNKLHFFTNWVLWKKKATQVQRLNGSIIIAVGMKWWNNVRRWYFLT